MSIPKYYFIANNPKSRSIRSCVWQSLNFEEYLFLKSSKKLNLWKRAKESTDPLLVQGASEQLNFEFKNFLQYGRLPEIVSYDIDSERNFIKLYVESLLNQSLGQDAVNYFEIQKPNLLASIVQEILSHNGQEFWINRLARESGNNKITIKKYIDILSTMGLIQVVSNTIKPLKQLNKKSKIYINSVWQIFVSKIVLDLLYIR